MARGITEVMVVMKVMKVVKVFESQNVLRLHRIRELIA